MSPETRVKGAPLGAALPAAWAQPVQGPPHPVQPALRCAGWKCHPGAAVRVSGESVLPVNQRDSREKAVRIQERERVRGRGAKTQPTRARALHTLHTPTSPSSGSWPGGERQTPVTALHRAGDEGQGPPGGRLRGGGPGRDPRGRSLRGRSRETGSAGRGLRGGSPGVVGRTRSRARTLGGRSPAPTRRSRLRPLRLCRRRHRHPASRPESLRSAGAGRGRGAGADPDRAAPERPAGSAERGAGPERRGEHGARPEGMFREPTRPGRARRRGSAELASGDPCCGPGGLGARGCGPHPRRTPSFSPPGKRPPSSDTAGLAPSGRLGASQRFTLLSPRGARPGLGVSAAARRSVSHSAPDSSLGHLCLPLPP